MYYEINVSKFNPVSKRHEHYFATHQRSLRSGELNARHAAFDFVERFPESEGFKVTLSGYEETGNQISICGEKI
jgi:hypothetical protein